jgi:hypothetical protein
MASSVRHSRRKRAFSNAPWAPAPFSDTGPADAPARVFAGSTTTMMHYNPDLTKDALTEVKGKAGATGA